MGTKIKYGHTSNFRELDAADLKKAGVEGFKKTRFNKDEVVEVDDDVAEALVDNESGLFDGEFEYVEDDDAELEEEPELTPAQMKAQAKADAEAAKSQTSLGSIAQTGDSGTPGSTGDTGKGTSTS